MIDYLFEKCKDCQCFYCKYYSTEVCNSNCKVCLSKRNPCKYQAIVAPNCVMYILDRRTDDSNKDKLLLSDSEFH